jgi:hypothetical protein
MREGACHHEREMVSTAGGDMNPMALLMAGLFVLGGDVFAQPAVHIDYPADGTAWPAGKPLVLQVSADGGPFLVIELNVDGKDIQDQVSSIKDSAFKGTLTWRDPSPGRHRLQVLVLDTQKNPAQAEIEVQVRASGAAPDPGVVEKVAAEKEMQGQAVKNTATAPKSAGVRFLTPGNEAVLRPGPGTRGFYRGEVELEAFGTAVWRMGVEVDGIKMSAQQFDGKDFHTRTQLPWWPWRGNDKYVVKVFADETPTIGTRRFTNEVTVRVEGIPPDVINPQNRIIAYYRERLGQNIFAPPITRMYNWSDTGHTWESAAYIGDTLYMVTLDDHDDIRGGRVAISRPPRADESGVPVQRPAGLYRVLIAFLDFGDTDITREDVLNAVPEVNRVVNEWHQNYARAHGLPKPILQLQMTGRYARVRPREQLDFTAAEIRTLTGVNPSDYNLLAQVDLSKENRSAGRGAGGMSYFGNPGPRAERVTLWTTLPTSQNIVEHLAGVLFDHELAHCLGWIHPWSVGDGGYVADEDRVSSIPSLMFGWTDTDGDGVIEIWDPTPYGMEKP